MIVTLTTDFGADSGYPAQVKGAVLSRAPGAILIDISHAIPAFDVASAALLLEECHGVFPRGTVHLAVVDPGVGTDRRPLALEYHGQRFVGPDNGIFEPFLDRAEVRTIERTELFRQPVASTFHGRDVFAPVAAYLARGGLIDDLGRVVGDALRLPWPSIERTERGVRAPVLRADNYGNLQTRLKREDLPLWGEVRTFLVREGDPPRELGPIRKTYGEVNAGELITLWGASGRLEIAVAQGSAAQRTAFKRGEQIWVQVDWK